MTIDKDSKSVYNFVIQNNSRKHPSESTVDRVLSVKEIQGVI